MEGFRRQGSAICYFFQGDINVEDHNGLQCFIFMINGKANRLGQKNERGNRVGGQQVRTSKKGLFSEI